MRELSKIMPAQVPQSGMPARARSQDRFQQLVPHQQLADGGGLAAGQDQPFHRSQVLGSAHLDGFGSKLGERLDMLEKGALESQDAYPGGGSGQAYQPRLCTSSRSGIEAMFRPDIASPRSREISTSRAASRKWVVASTMALARRAGLPEA